MSSVYAFVLAWNHYELTENCLMSFLDSEYGELSCFVIDNGSTDGTQDLIKLTFPNVEVIRSNQNLGIAGGYNLGLERAQRDGVDYSIIANNDIVLDREAVANLTECMDTNPDVGIAMPKIYQEGREPNRIWCAGGEWKVFPPRVKMLGVNAADDERYSTPKDIQYAPSCCLMLRMASVSTVGMFDSGFFFYNDDWDFSERMRSEGFRIRLVPSAKVWHKGSMSTKEAGNQSKWWRTYGKSSSRFYLKHRSLVDLIIFSIWFIIRETVKLKPSRIIPFVRGAIEEFSEIHSTTARG